MFCVYGFFLTLPQLPDLTDTSDKERAEELERELEIWKEKFEELSQKVC